MIAVARAGLRRHQRQARSARVTGRVFVVSGATLGLSGLSLLAQVTSVRTPVADVARGLFGLALLIGGALGYFALPVSALPQVDFPTVQVTTQLPGGSADLIECSEWSSPYATTRFASLKSADSISNVPPFQR